MRRTGSILTCAALAASLTLAVSARPVLADQDESGAAKAGDAKSGDAKSGEAKSGAGTGKPLYDRLGGKSGINAVVDDFVANVLADSKINKYFAKTDAAKFKGLLVDQICEASGGPCKYTGKTMKAAHQGMGITGADFNALIQDLVASLNKHKVGPAEQYELIATLAKMSPDIVEKP